MRAATTIGFAVALAVAVLPVRAQAITTAPRTAAVVLQGASQGTEKVCGVRRRAAIARRGRRVVAVVRSVRRPVTLVVERCRAGRWKRASTVRRAAGSGWFRTVVPTHQLGHLRLRARVGDRRAARGSVVRPSYLSVHRADADPPSTPGRPNPSADKLVDVPVSFQVRNVNGSQLACPSDGRAYRIAGRLVGTRAALAKPAPAVTLWLHELAFGRFFWHFPNAANDFAGDLARAGRVSVVIDRLGYDDSDRPPGNDTCLGAQADMAHQIVGALRAGRYGVEGVAPRAFARVAVGGHSAGGAIAELEAYSFADADALVLLAWAAQGFTSRATQEAVEQGRVCALGGEPSDPGGPGGYAYFGQTGQAFREVYFADGDPEVVAAAEAMRNRDPCGDPVSLNPAIAQSNARAPAIAVPILLVYGRADAVYQQPGAGEGHASNYSGSREVTTIFVDRAGHALTLERSAPATAANIAGWLAGRGL